MDAGRNISEGLDEREQLRIEFYATYDVMTGIRIAATLGGFFGLMVFLIIYKSRSKSVKALKDPKIAEIAHAVAAEEEAQEEERQLAYALEEALGARCSLAGSLAPWPPRPRSARFSSLGGGCGSLLAPPRRLVDLRGNSLPASALVLGCASPYYEDEIMDGVDDSSCAPPSEYVNKFLSVPRGSRRYSSITCSSSGSSYLERRGSSIVCALPAVPPSPRIHKARQSRRNTLQEAEIWSDHKNPIDIQVIQATPELSPCVSERTVVNLQTPIAKRADYPPQKKAPLASIGSCGVSISVDYQDCDLHSVGSDSVFLEDECIDTDDEIEQFSTDSEDSINFRKKANASEETRELRPRRRSKNIVGKSIPMPSSPPLSVSSTLLTSTSKTSLMKKNPSLFKPITRKTLRRLSHPAVIGTRCSTISATVVNNPSTISEETTVQNSKTTLKRMFPLLPFGATKKSPTCESPPEFPTSFNPCRSQDVELGMRTGSEGAEDIYQVDINPPLNPEHCSRSQETLF